VPEDLRWSAWRLRPCFCHSAISWSRARGWDLHKQRP